MWQSKVIDFHSNRFTRCSTGMRFSNRRRRRLRAVLFDDVGGETDGEFALTRFDGNQTTFPVVLRELAMMTMFGDGQYYRKFYQKTQKIMENSLTEVRKSPHHWDFPRLPKLRRDSAPILLQEHSYLCSRLYWR